jgi:hypothetical protein
MAHLLQFWREERAWERAVRARESGRSRRGTRTRALVTMVHNESVFFPIWLRYYSRSFAPADIHVFDNDTTDGSTDGPGFVRIPVERGEVDHVWMQETIQAKQHELLERYDVVVVCDVDEIIAPVPELGPLSEYLDRFDDPYVNTLGYEIVHMKDREPPIELGEPILGQRRWWFPNDAYTKPIVATEPQEWVPGFHARADRVTRIDPDLRLLHLHRMDFGLALERHRTRRRKPWAPTDQEQAWAVHNQIVDPEAFERWFYTDSGFRGFTPNPEPIPASWWGVV